MNFSRFFVDRPIFAAVLSIIIFAVGAISIPNLPISEYPEVAPPSVLVRTVYPGANPKEIAVMWPPQRGPILAAIYITETDATLEQRNAAIADIGRALAAAVAR